MRLARTALVLAVLLALAMPAVASEVTIAGWARYAVLLPVTIQNATLAPASQVYDALGQGRYGRLYATYKIDDFNTFRLYYEGADTAVSVLYAYLTTDLAKYAKLDAAGLGLTLGAGRYGSWDNAYNNVTNNGNEDISSAGVGTYWALWGTVGYKTFFTLEWAWAPGSLDAAKLRENDFYVGLSTVQSGDWGKVSAEVAYDGNPHTYVPIVAVGDATPATQYSTLADGIVVADAAYEKAFGDITMKVGAGMNYNLNLNPEKNGLTWAAAVKASHKTLGTVAVGVKGATLDNWTARAQTLTSAGGFVTAITDVAAYDPAAVFQYVYSEIVVNAIKNMALLGYVRLNLDPAQDIFNAMDVAVRFDVGAADFYLGYQLGQAANWATLTVARPTTVAYDDWVWAAHGGPWFKMEISY